MNENEYKNFFLYVHDIGGCLTASVKGLSNMVAIVNAPIHP